MNSSVCRCARESVCVDACVTALRKVVACVRVQVFEFTVPQPPPTLPLPSSCFHCDAAAPDSTYPRDTYRPILLLLNIFCINLWLGMSRLTNLSNARLDYIETTRRRIFEWRFLSDFVFRERR